MSYQFNHLDHLKVESLDDVIRLLTQHNCELAFVKKLAKNNNDKQQVFIHRSIGIFNSTFELKFEERGLSESVTKPASNRSKKIPSAVFSSFSWVSRDGSLHPVKACKAILYAQYPETRLSSFKTVSNEMPRSMSVEYTRSVNLLSRFLVLGATREGRAVAIMVVDPSAEFENVFKHLPPLPNTKIIKQFRLREDQTPSQELAEKLTDYVVNKTFPGQKLLIAGSTKPFNGTQVCGYTLESVLGIAPNANKDGDYKGIELKAMTQNKVTLMTTEPDGGHYANSFGAFVQKFGYTDDNGLTYRMNGLMRAWTRNEKTGLTLKILRSKIISSKLICSGAEYIYPFELSKNQKLIKEKAALQEAVESGRTQNQEEVSKRWEYTFDHSFKYDPAQTIDTQSDGFRIALVTDDGEEQAVWTLERLLNNWGKKHNEAVYVSATKSRITDEKLTKQGFKYLVSYQPTVLWCKKTTIDYLFRAIDSGILFLDPGHKYVPGNLKENSRRSQWRVNNIFEASKTLYDFAEKRVLGINKKAENSKN